MDDFRLTSKQVESLKKVHRSERDKRLADRVKAVIGTVCKGLVE